jgi:hypothetical protein
MALRQQETAHVGEHGRRLDNLQGDYFEGGKEDQSQISFFLSFTTLWPSTHFTFFTVT